MLFTANDKFRLEVLEFSGEKVFQALYRKIFQIVHVLAGECEVDTEKLKAGNTFLITAEAMKQDITLKVLTSEIKLAIMSVGSDWVTYL